MIDTHTGTLRLFMPQWQGGNNPAYSFGAHLLSWLAPDSDSPTVEVPIAPYEGIPSEIENGIAARSALLKQMRSARHMIEAYGPDRLVVLGGDCSVDLIPFAYLNKRYDGGLAVLWLDAHPDVSTPDRMHHANTMVLGNLLGEGDAEFAKEVEFPIKAENVMFAGLQKVSAADAAFIGKKGIRQAGPDALAENSDEVARWLKDSGVRYLAIHLDLDVLNPAAMRLPFVSPANGDYAEGMTIPQLLRLMADISAIVEVVGIGIAEYLPREAAAVRKMLENLPLLGGKCNPNPEPQNGISGDCS